MTDGMLPPKLVSFDLALPQMPPEQAFRIGHVAAQASRIAPGSRIDSAEAYHDRLVCRANQCSTPIPTFPLQGGRSKRGSIPGTAVQVRPIPTFPYEGGRSQFPPPGRGRVRVRVECQRYPRLIETVHQGNPAQTLPSICARTSSRYAGWSRTPPGSRRRSLAAAPPSVANGAPARGRPGP